MMAKPTNDPITIPALAPPARKKESNNHMKHWNKDFNSPLYILVILDDFDIWQAMQHCWKAEHLKNSKIAKCESHIFWISEDKGLEFFYGQVLHLKISEMTKFEGRNF